MIGLTLSNLCSQPQVEGTLLTPEEVEEISTRISRSVSQKISEQLEKALASSLEKDKTRQFFYYKDGKSAISGEIADLLFMDGS